MLNITERKHEGVIAMLSSIKKGMNKREVRNEVIERVAVILQHGVTG